MQVKLLASGAWSRGWTPRLPCRAPAAPAADHVQICGETAGQPAPTRHPAAPAAVPLLALTSPLEAIAGSAASVTLRDGSHLRLRRARSEDNADLQELHQGMTPESRYFRFLSGAPHLAERFLTSLRAANDNNVIGLVGEKDGHMVAAAHCVRDRRDPRRAEIAFVVQEGQHGLGIATSLLRELAHAARARHIESFDALVHCDNRKMLNVLSHSGFDVHRERQGDTYQISFATAPAG